MMWKKKISWNLNYMRIKSLWRILWGGFRNRTVMPWVWLREDVAFWGWGLKYKVSLRPSTIGVSLSNVLGAVLSPFQLEIGFNGLYFKSQAYYVTVNYLFVSILNKLGFISSSRFFFNWSIIDITLYWFQVYNSNSMFVYIAEWSP